jgi:hypothetical protein
LTGAADYHGWSSAMCLDLQSAGLWNHVSEGVNILDPLNYAKLCPSIWIGSPLEAFTALLKWQSDDATVFELLLCCMSITVKTILPTRPLPKSVPVALTSLSSSASTIGSTLLDLADPVPDTKVLVTACDYWIHLWTQYDHIDLVAQMALCTQLLSLEMGGLAGVDAYLGVFNSACDCFVGSGPLHRPAH